jgi:hypothetical protein
MAARKHASVVALRFSATAPGLLSQYANKLSGHANGIAAAMRSIGSRGRRNSAPAFLLTRASYICRTHTWLAAAAQTQIGDINDSNRRTPGHYFPSHIRVAGHYPAIGAPAFDQGGDLHARHRRRTQQHQPG